MQLSSLILLTLPIVFLKRYYIRQERKRRNEEKYKFNARDTNELELREVSKFLKLCSFAMS